MEKTDIEKLSDLLGVKFVDEKLLEQALVHRSFLNEKPGSLKDNNERLEFLGDAVLELVITEHLYRTFPQKAEGDLTSFRSALVKTSSLSETALAIGIGDFVLMSKGEERTGGRTRPFIMANTYEAILGAMYLDLGFEACRDFVKRTLLPKLDEIVEKRLDIDNKSHFQELTQEVIGITPIYDLIRQTGPDHSKIFAMAAIVNGFTFGKGKGHNKQEAEQNAAADALANWTEKLALYRQKKSKTSNKLKVTKVHLQKQDSSGKIAE